MIERDTDERNGFTMMMTRLKDRPSRSSQKDLFHHT